ncbi:MAG TPA: hypothetical protein DEP53_06535, partial [Bacteroidetes bacterium]|nr:hypothetical protein [Bacteroidota bacterium]
GDLLEISNGPESIDPSVHSGSNPEHCGRIRLVLLENTGLAQDAAMRKIGTSRGHQTPTQNVEGSTENVGVNKPACLLRLVPTASVGVIFIGGPLRGPLALCIFLRKFVL